MVLIFFPVLLHAAVVILKTLDIVLTEISSCLNLDENHRDLADVLDTVGRPRRDIHGFSALEDNLPPIEGDFRGSGDNHPVLGSLFVTLVAEPLFRENLDPFDFVAGRLIENCEAAPRPLIRKHLWRIHFPNSNPQ